MLTVWRDAGIQLTAAGANEFAGWASRFGLARQIDAPDIGVEVHLSVGYFVTDTRDRWRLGIVSESKPLRRSTFDWHAPDVSVSRAVENGLAVSRPGQSTQNARALDEGDFVRFPACCSPHVDSISVLGKHTIHSEIFAVW
jgi:hypothetical protein